MRHQHGVLESAASSRRGDDPVMLRPSLPLGEGRTQCAGSACVTTTKRFRLLEKKPRTASAIFTMLLLWLLFLFREQVSLGADLPRLRRQSHDTHQRGQKGVREGEGRGGYSEGLREVPMVQTPAGPLGSRTPSRD